RLPRRQTQGHRPARGLGECRRYAAVGGSARDLWAYCHATAMQVAAVKNPGCYVLIYLCRNDAQFMRQTRESVLAQSIRPATWVIVDDGSTDQTPQILAA